MLFIRDKNMTRFKIHITRVSVVLVMIEDNIEDNVKLMDKVIDSECEGSPFVATTFMFNNNSNNFIYLH